MGKLYRTRIYYSYVSGRSEALAPSTLDGLKPRLPYLRRLVQKHFPNDLDANILDLGCGHGALIHVAKQLGYRNLHGADASPEQVAAAEALGIEGVERADVMEALKNHPDASVDCIVTFDLIEHFDRDELITLVDAVYRVLKSGGRWIIHTPNGESPFGMRSFTRTSLGQLLISSGFSRLETYEDQPVPHGIKSAVRWLGWKGLRILLRLYLAVETGDTGREAIFSQNFLAVAYK